MASVIIMSKNIQIHNVLHFLTFLYSSHFLYIFQTVIQFDLDSEATEDTWVEWMHYLTDSDAIYESDIYMVEPLHNCGSNFVHHVS